MSEIEQLTYFVPGVSCGHCRAVIIAEVEKLAGVSSVDVDLEAKRVAVAGTELDAAAVRTAIDEAGYDADLASGHFLPPLKDVP
jgi:copper chaperone